ncbi:MAG: cell division protein ZipA [Gammaproteobacteria bacterium]|nr:cell division protein ZipA [Gammaproteobacteria bacterium]
MDPVLFVLLVIVGIIIIGFVYFDAKRRQVARQEKRDQKRFEQQFANKQDSAGFDMDGIGEVRLVEAAQNKVIQEKIKQAEASAESRIDESVEELVEAEEPVKNQVKEPSFGAEEVPVLDDMLFGFDKDKLDSSEARIEPKVEQPTQTSLFEEESESAPVDPELIFTLYIVSPNDAPYQGEKLVQALLEQGMRHGDMDIFHRHSQSTGRGPVQFSLANAYEPGTFDLDKLDQLETKGLAVFMALPGAKKPLKAYELMINTCKALVEELGGYIIDSSKAHFSKQIEAHHKEQIQEFERKLLLKQG